MQFEDNELGNPLRAEYDCLGNEPNKSLKIFIYVFFQ